MSEWPWLLELDPPPDPVAVFQHLAHDPFALFLDSALLTPAFAQQSAPPPAAHDQAPIAPLGRYSFITAYPFATLVSHGERTGFTQTDSGLTTVSTEDPFTLLQETWRRFAQPTHSGLPPFQGGVAGYWGYELAHRLEKSPFAGVRAETRPAAERPRGIAPAPSALPDMALGFYDWVLAWDHLPAGVFAKNHRAGGRCWLICRGWPAGEASARRSHAQRRAEQILALIAQPAQPLPPWVVSWELPVADSYQQTPRFPVPGHPGVTSTFRRPSYLEAVQRVLAHISAGDVYQVNLTQRLHLPLTAHPWVYYQRLRQINPAPFAAYFALPHAGGAILSASPERFLRVQEGQVETRPIKGTRPRGRTAASDAALRAELIASAKDQAENVMIVDLLRHDLSKVCRPFSVQTPELFAIESYATVHHLVSTVIGRLRPGLDAVDLLRACFPGGSITGAPKVRAMQIIAALEPTDRGVYCGALGYLGFDGAFDSSIAIRTAVASAHELSFGVGGGIVADSDPRAEYAETLHKAAGLLAGLTLP